MNNSNKLVGGQGAKRLTGTGAFTGLNRETLLAESATVISVCTGVNRQGDAINFKTHADFTWSDLAVGIPYTVPNGWKITAVTLTSGAVVAY